MPKQMPDAHTCKMCESLMLVLEINRNTETNTLQAWKKFASPRSLSLLRTVNGLEAFLRLQLKTMNPFLTTSLKKLRSRAAKGCLLAAYILKKMAKTIGFLKSGGLYPEQNDAYHPFHVRATHLGGDLSAMFAAKREWNIEKGQTETWDPWPDNIPDERVFICTEPMPDQEPEHEPSGSWRFRWFAEPYRPFHRMHFLADDDCEDAHVADDGERIDLFWTIRLGEYANSRLPGIFEYEPGSDRAFKAVRKFIDSRIPTQNEVKGSYMPTRLINLDVSNPRSHTRIRLVNSSAKSLGSVYAALSYCWGGDQKLKLTKANYSQLFENIEFASLPLTLQDAVIVAAKFDILYLWVDALCIIQDDEADVGHELGLMAQVYRNASLTISASRAKSVNEGFLQPRLPFKDTAEVSFRLLLFQPQTQHMESIACFPASDLIGYEPPVPKLGESAHHGNPNDPLISRAWCFQERALSNCLVEFGILSTRARVDQANKPIAAYNDSWRYDRCYIIPFSNYGVHSLFYGSVREKVFDGLRDGYNVVSSKSRLPQGRKGLYTYWSAILTFYSILNLSFLKDRLPAFSAIASTFAPFMGSEQDYLAGIWKETLPVGLLWATYAEDKAKDGILIERVAPTWSWASIGTQVTYTTSTKDGDPDWDFEQNVLSRGLTLDQGFEVLHYQTELTYEEVPFGALTHGELRLRGRLLPVRLSLEKSLEHDMTLDPRGRIQTKMQAAGIHRRVAGNFDKERGLHRRSYQHPNAAFREQVLRTSVSNDRNEDAFEAMVAEAH
jgi:hypothetical protein